MTLNNSMWTPVWETGVYPDLIVHEQVPLSLRIYVRGQLCGSVPAEEAWDHVYEQVIDTRILL